MVNILYHLKIHYGDVILEKVEVIKETPKQYKLDSNESYRSIVNKSQMDTILDDSIFTINNIEQAKGKFISRAKSRINRYNELIEDENEIIKQLENIN